MLRRLEKGLNNAKLKSQTLEASTSVSPTDWRMRRGEPRPQSPGRYSNDLPRLNLPASFDGDDRADPKLRSATDEEENESEGKPDGMFPVDLIRRENQRHSFFKTILNPSHENPATSLRSDRSNSTSSSQAAAHSSASHVLKDPVAAGILDESNAKVLFDLVFLRLNPFVNLFDPALHTPDYVRSKSPFLFTVLLTAGCKFFKPESFKPCQKLAHEFSIRAFADNAKSVEIVQAFACLTYWREPEDTVRASTRIDDSLAHAIAANMDVYWSGASSPRSCVTAVCDVFYRLVVWPLNWALTATSRHHRQTSPSYNSGNVVIASAPTSYCSCTTGA